MTKFEKDKYRLTEELDYVLNYVSNFVSRIKDEINSAQTESELMKIVSDYMDTFDALCRLGFEDMYNEWV